MSDLEKLRAEHKAAERALYDLKTEVREAVRAVEASFEARLRVAREAISQAESAIQLAENEAVKPHEWTGLKVTRREYETRRWGNGRTGKVTDYFGVVFTYRNGDPLARGMGYCPAGTAIVRLLKKDGTPGLKMERLDRYGWHSDDECRWHPVDQSPAQSDKES
ncbi:hypothetical protein LTR94_023422 [Friedmanniomyces endolithicus]|nr:hypothetical protein LTR94_023422 [Friedmanniomyces endolithicus]